MIEPEEYVSLPPMMVEPEEYVSLPPMTTGDKIATSIVTAILLLGAGAIWVGIFGIVRAFTGWTP